MQRSAGRAVILGSAAGGGYPQWNCRCAVCRPAWDGVAGAEFRTQTGVAVTGDGVGWVLLDASPDLAAQIRATPCLWPRKPGRDSPIVAVVLTSADIDHFAGLLSLRERHNFKLYATDCVHRVLDANSLFRVLDPGLVERVVARPGIKFVEAGLTFQLFSVPGKIPLYAESFLPEIGLTAGENSGIAIETAGQFSLYAPGCAEMDESLARHFQSADTLLFDGTFFDEEEMFAAGVGEKSARRMGHMPVSGPGGSLRLLTKPTARRVYLHINNTNPMLLADSPERRLVEAAGFEVAFDGMEIEL